MPEPTARQKVNGHIAVSSVFLLLALAGWAGFAYTARSSSERHSELITLVERVKTEQAELRAERDRLAAEHRQRTAEEAEVDYLRNRVTALDEERRALVEDRDQARAEIATLKQEIATLQEKLADSEPPAVTGTTRPGSRRLQGSRSRSR